MKKILLIEPNYKNKYPPLGLMKISTYHKEKGDNVFFYKGFSRELKKRIWDRIYISTLFTFYWNKTIKTIKYYSESVNSLSDIFVGGVMATLMESEIKKEINVNIVKGLLNEKGKLGYEDDDKIDFLTPDYSIVDQKVNTNLNYLYPTNNSYIAYATRGCIRNCEFCAVPIIEPTFTNNLSIAKQVEDIRKRYGEKRHLLLLDNNVLASKKFPEIIEEIKNAGFGKGAKYISKKNGKRRKITRYVDFNQGIDARLLTREKMKLLSEIAIKPVRIAFDDIKYKDIYIKKVKLAAEFGIKTLSNYLLFNFKDSPDDLYERMKINIELNEEFEKNGYQSKIWSFPMKFAPIKGEYCKNRRYVGNKWNKKYLRGMQCILLATHGVIGPKRIFFEKAFGKDFNEFKKILSLPEHYIIYRNEHEKNGDIKYLEKMINSLNKKKTLLLRRIILNNSFSNLNDLTCDENILEIIKIYKQK
ncbi:MAG: hypothetical protein ACOWWH_11520 [Eubacteriaceae bacterium]